MDFLISLQGLQDFPPRERTRAKQIGHSIEQATTFAKDNRIFDNKVVQRFKLCRMR